MAKDSWGEYDDGGLGLRNFFLQRVSDLAPVVFERLRPGLDCKDYHGLWCFLGDWARECSVDTDWFRQSGEFTLRSWASSGIETKELVQLGGRNLVPVTITVYPQLQRWHSMRLEIERACEAAGLKKAPSGYHLEPSKLHIDWLIRRDILEDEIDAILDRESDPNGGSNDNSKFYAALRDLRQRLGIPAV